MADYITEPKKNIPIIADADLCVVGGSCTGVFAAVRAAKLGLDVVLIEQHNMLGGTAVTGLVNYWHSLHDTDDNEQVIAGLTYETLQRLDKRNALVIGENANVKYNFSPWELTLILDQYIKENKIKVMLHTSYSSLVTDGDKISAIIVENVDGRGAIRSKFFIDATGDGRLCRDLGLVSYVHDCIQPPTSCFHMMGDFSGVDLNTIVREHGSEFGLEDDWGWSASVAGCDGISLRADNHVFNVRCDIAKDLCFAEIEGRRQADAFLSLVRKYGNQHTKYAITALCSHIGIRDTVHFKTRFKADMMSLLTGKRYDAPIMNGTYRVDIHHSEDMGITFRYLDGGEDIIYGKDTRHEKWNWRERMGIEGEPAKYYQLPFDILVNERYSNFIPVGRMINADMGAYGALRVMVNLNQLGEAAGVAAYLCINSSKSVNCLDGRFVTEKLREGGSAL